ncbi:MAG: helix-turn-helix transcriptional regulator [Streptomyces sp.]|nr:helix-turn-helix transcriptional regulator [Streptomyces sp.]
MGTLRTPARTHRLHRPCGGVGHGAGGGRRRPCHHAHRAGRGGKDACGPSRRPGASGRVVPRRRQHRRAERIAGRGVPAGHSGLRGRCARGGRTGADRPAHRVLLRQARPPGPGPAPLRPAPWRPRRFRPAGPRSARSRPRGRRHRWGPNRLLIMKVLCLWASGEPDAARDLGRTVLRSALEQGETMSVAVTVEYLSWVACGKGEHEPSTALLGGAGALWRQVGRLLWGEAGLNGPHKATENDLMDALGAEHFTHLHTYGTTRPVQDLTELAVGGARFPQARAPRAQDSSPLGPLTPREREVAHLIADHLSNREIAERLVISARTADTHVEHILAKLGFTSRSQSAAVITETAKNSPYDDPISP